MSHPNQTYRDFNNRDPYDFYESLRADSPVSWDDSMGGWLINSYDDCSFIERREDIFVHPYSEFDGAKEVKGTRSILLLQGAQHRSMHKYLAGYLSKVENLASFRRRFIGPLADRLVRTFTADGEVEFAEAFADQLPISVIAAMLGLPWEDDDLLRRCKFLNDEFTRWSETFGDEESVLANARTAAAEMEDILRPYIRARRDHPQDDLISALWAEGPNILPDWNEDDVMSQCKTLFPAGGQTTAYLLCNMMFLLTRDQDLSDYVRQTPEQRLPPFIDETLRLHGTIHFRVREALADTTLSGQHIQAGQRVFPINSAANRDGAKFDNPQELRREGRPQRHLAFNVGPRVCVGEALARAEALEAYLRLFATTSDISLNPDREPPHLSGFMSRSFRPLHLQMKAAA